MNSKNIAILAHLTPIGWLLALIINQANKDKFTIFYLRQTLGVFICFFLTRFIPDYYIIAWGFIFIFWTYSFVGAVKESESLVPFAGIYFQKWFAVIS
jgi:hypothetical protein